MRSKSLVHFLALLGATAVPLIHAAPAQAETFGAWLSGLGTDPNPCTRTNPCKTWAAALAQIAPGGQVSVIDPGDFGAATITTSVALDGGGGQAAGTLAASTAGITVAVGPNEVVILRNLRISGLNGSGTHGINFTSGAKLIIDNCDIYGFGQNGINIATTTPGSIVLVKNTRIENVGNSGIGVSGSGAVVETDNVRIYGSRFGVAVASGNKAVFSRSESSAASGAGLEVDGGGQLFVDNSVIGFNAVGISNGGTLTIGNSGIVFNTNGIIGGGATNSYTNNRFAGNVSDGAVTALNPNPSNPTGQQ